MRVDHLSRAALRVVVDAVARAHCGPVERTWGHRLALELLIEAKVAEPWQARSFWDALAMEWGSDQPDSGAVHEQVAALSCSIKAWSSKLGREIPDAVEMGRLARPYMPDLETAAGTQQNPCMCNRYTPGDRQLILDHFAAVPARAFNAGPDIVHPRDPGWVVRLDGDRRILDQMTWGFPVYLRGKSGQPLKAKPVNNARFDKLGSFWKRWAAMPVQRCLIPATAYAEAVGTPGQMTTTWLSMKDAPMFAWAGLWRSSDEWGNCYTGVMTHNAPEFEAIHDRSPVILEQRDWETWLRAPLEELYRFDRPYPAHGMKVDATQILWKDGGTSAPTSPSAGDRRSQGSQNPTDQGRKK